jgi:hypothetical protein
VAAGKGIVLQFFEEVQRIPDALCEEYAFELNSLYVSKGKSRSHCRKEDISHIGKVIGKTDGRYIEVKPFPVFFKVPEDSKERREKIVGGVSKVRKLREKGEGYLFQDQGGVVAKEEIVNPDQERINRMGVDVRNQATQAVEDDGNKDHRIKGVKNIEELMRRPAGCKDSKNEDREEQEVFSDKSSPAWNLKVKEQGKVHEKEDEKEADEINRPVNSSIHFKR